MKKPEILSPAGDFEKLRFAVEYGADAVYMAGKTYGMRTASGNFDSDELSKAVKYCHERGVKCKAAYQHPGQHRQLQLGMHVP